MNINDDIFIREFGQEKSYILPFFDGDDALICRNVASDCLIVRLKLAQINWIIIISETSSAIRTTAIGFDVISNSKNETFDGYIVHHSVPKPQKSRGRA